MFFYNSWRVRALNTQEGKEENSAFIRLNVIESPDNREIAPEIIVAPDDLQIVKGASEATLDCIASARPLYELETLWFKDGIPIENAGISYSLNDIWNRSLALVSINTTHSGSYQCSVNLRSGGFPNVTATAQVRITKKRCYSECVWFFDRWWFWKNRGSSAIPSRKH